MEFTDYKKYTESEQANLTFFGNNVSLSTQIDSLKLYLNEIHKYIEVTNHHLQNNKIHAYDFDTLSDLKSNYEHHFGDILRKSFIISSIILFESELDQYCRDFQEHKKLKVSYKDFKGDLFEKFKMYSQRIIELPFNFNSRIWQDVIGLYEIRNCLIHNYGSIENHSKRKQIENFILYYDSFTIEDDYIRISHGACIKSVEIIDAFFYELTRLALEYFPGHYGGKS